MSEEDSIESTANKLMSYFDKDDNDEPPKSEDEPPNTDAATSTPSDSNSNSNEPPNSNEPTNTATTNDEATNATDTDTNNNESNTNTNESTATPSKSDATGNASTTTTKSDTSPLLEEAERQAAIAAALSQTSSSFSIVAGMARQCQATGLAGSTGNGGVGSSTVSSSSGSGVGNSLGGSSSGSGANEGYTGTVVPLPPLENNLSNNSNSNSLPVPILAGKPVRFEHVKAAFERLWMEELRGEEGETRGEEGHLVDEQQNFNTDEHGLGDEQLSDNKLAGEAGSVDNREGLNGIEGEAAADTPELNAAEQDLTVDDSSLNKLSEKGEEATNDLSIEIGSKSEQNQDSTEAAAATTINDTPPKTTTKPNTQPTTIPDSFLRFLLLTTRTPLIIEESKQLHRQKQRSIQESEANALSAAKRALEIYTLATSAYNDVTAHPKGVWEEDTTSAFFASCSGEAEVTNMNGSPSSPVHDAESPKSPKRPTRKSLADIPTAASAMASASSMFSSVISKVSKKTPPKPKIEHVEPETSLDIDYEILIDQEMLGLTVENVLERTIIRTLLPEGAAKRAGAKIGSLIAKVGNVDTFNLTHFETIDELRQSQRPLKLTLRRISSEVLKCAREEMGRLIRGKEETTLNSKPWRVSVNEEETFDSILKERWPGRQKGLLNVSPGVMTRNEMIHRAGRDLIKILALLVVGLEKELSALPIPDDSSLHSSCGSNPDAITRRRQLKDALEITSKILLEYAKKHPEVMEERKTGGSTGHAGSSFYPVPPGRVGKKQPPKQQKKKVEDTPLLRIGDALQRTTSFLVEPLSSAATTLRWEIIDYLCVVLDLDLENELAEKEAASSSTEGGDASSQMNDLGSAGSILKLIVVNCSTSEGPLSGIDCSEEVLDVDMMLPLGQSSPQRSSSGHSNSHSGNPFLSVVHRLAASKSISARVSACSLGPVLWAHLDFPRQLQLRGVITRALHDVDLTVRKSTATVLHEIAELVFDRRSVPWLVLMCERSMTDPEPQLRAAAMTLTWHLAEHLPNAFLGDASKGSRSLRRLPPRTDPTFMDVYLLQCKLLPVASNLAEDKMPSVRLSVAAQCDRLCSAMGEHWFSVIIDLLQALLSDADERVRSEAVLCMPRLVESVVVGTSKGQTITVLESLLPQALRIQSDSSPEVRAALATATGDLLIFLVGAEDNNNGSSSSIDVAPPSPGRGALSNPSQYKKYVDDSLIPILQKLLQDSNPAVTTASLRAVTNASRSSTAGSSSRIPSTTHNYDSIDDDLQSISSHQSIQSHTSFDRRKPVFIPVLSEEQVLRLLPTLSNLATSREWRVRQSAVEIVPALLGCTYQHETRHEISKFCLRLMGDKVDAVRKTAAECLCLGGSNLARHGEDDGGAWITNIVVPHLKTCSQSEDSKQRLLCLKMIEIIITNELLSPSSPRVDSKTDISLNSSFETTSDSVCEVETSSMKTILDIAASLSSDKVANVRLNVGRVFGSVMLLLDKPDANFAINILEKQLDDEKSRAGGGDRDVIYFSQQAISVAQHPRRLSSSEVMI